MNLLIYNLYKICSKIELKKKKSLTSNSDNIERAIIMLDTNK